MGGLEDFKVHINKRLRNKNIDIKEYLYQERNELKNIFLNHQNMVFCTTFFGKK